MTASNYNTRRAFKHQLLRGAAILMVSAALVGCGNSAKETVSEKITSGAQAVNITKDKMIEYTVKGQTDADHLYLEEVLGEAALSQVKTWNKSTLDRLTADPRFAQMEAEALEILQSKDKIPYVSYRKNKLGELFIGHANMGNCLKY